MINKLIYFTLPLFLTGCIGSIVSGQTEHLGEDYPDIRNVPERLEAMTLRGLHEGEENASRTGELQKLEQDREKISARNEALREEAFSSQNELQPEVILPDGKDAL